MRLINKARLGAGLLGSHLLASNESVDEVLRPCPILEKQDCECGVFIIGMFETILSRLS